MAVYAYIVDGKIEKRKNFGEETPPVLAPTKGKWVIIDETRPPRDEMTEKYEQVIDDVSVRWEVVPMTEQELLQKQQQ